MAEIRLGCQTPTQSVILPYYETKGSVAIKLYNESGRITQEWQELLLSDILSVNEEGLWVHVLCFIKNVNTNCIYRHNMLQSSISSFN